MKKNLLVLFIAGIYCNHVSAQLTINNNPLIKKLNDTTVIVTQKAIVPSNHIFYMYNSNGKLAKIYKSGQSIMFPNAHQSSVQKNAAKQIVDFIRKGTKGSIQQNCFTTPCPAGAPAGAVCWKCQ